VLYNRIFYGFRFYHTRKCEPLFSLVSFYVQRYAYFAQTLSQTEKIVFCITIQIVSFRPPEHVSGYRDNEVMSKGKVSFSHSNDSVHQSKFLMIMDDTIKESMFHDFIWSAAGNK